MSTPMTFGNPDWNITDTQVYKKLYTYFWSTAVFATFCETFVVDIVIFLTTVFINLLCSFFLKGGCTWHAASTLAPYIYALPGLGAGPAQRCLERFPPVSHTLLTPHSRSTADSETTQHRPVNTIRDLLRNNRPHGNTSLPALVLNTNSPCLRLHLCIQNKCCAEMNDYYRPPCL